MFFGGRVFYLIKPFRVGDHTCAIILLTWWIAPHISGSNERQGRTRLISGPQPRISPCIRLSWHLHVFDVCLAEAGGDDAITVYQVEPTTTPAPTTEPKGYEELGCAKDTKDARVRWTIFNRHVPNSERNIGGRGCALMFGMRGNATCCYSAPFPRLPRPNRPLYFSFQVMTTGPIGKNGSEMSAEVTGGCFGACVVMLRVLRFHWIWSPRWAGFDG